jgi:hypothetical protein
MRVVAAAARPRGLPIPIAVRAQAVVVGVAVAVVLPAGGDKGVGESAGQNRQGVADERAVRERASDPSRP